MPDFEWDESFSIGIVQVDQHNKHLIMLLNDLYEEMIEQPNMLRTRLQFEELSDYINFHFACEEIWMGCTGYILITEHKEQHKKLKQMLVDIYETYPLGDMSSLDMLSSLAISIITHIKECDTTYGNFAHDKLSAKLMTKRHITHQVS